jgi:hypothetical protein
MTSLEIRFLGLVSIVLSAVVALAVVAAAAGLAALIRHAAARLRASRALVHPPTPGVARPTPCLKEAA